MDEAFMDAELYGTYEGVIINRFRWASTNSLANNRGPIHHGKRAQGAFIANTSFRDFMSLVLYVVQMYIDITYMQ